MTGPLRHMPRPCDASDTGGPCPFRVDAPPGEFPAERFEKLADTAGLPGAEAPHDAPMFACHHVADSPEGGPQPIACAGWLAVCGGSHLGVRMAVVQRRLDPAALRVPDGVELFGSYDDMATQQSDGVYSVERANGWRTAAGHHRSMLDKWGGSLVLRDAESAEACEERGSGGRDTVRGAGR